MALRDSNPGDQVPQANALSITPRIAADHSPGRMRSSVEFRSALVLTFHSDEVLSLFSKTLTFEAVGDVIAGVAGGTDGFANLKRCLSGF